MAVKASATITIFNVDDIAGTIRYYKLVVSGSSAPSKPAENADPDSTWTKTEPSVDTSKVLYFVDQTLWSNGGKTYSEVSKSSSYEAAKEAYTKAQNAQNTAQSAQDDIDNLNIGGRNYLATNLCQTIEYNGIIFTPTGDGGIRISGENNTPSGHGTAYSFPTGNLVEGGYYSLFAGTYTLSISGSEHYMNMVTDKTRFYYRLKRDTRYGSNISYTFVGNAITFTLEEDVEKVYIGFGFYEPAEIVEGVIYFKLEKGTRATDWTPAPEDVVSKIEEVSDALDAFEDVIVGTQTAATGSWTGVAKFKELKDGQRIAYWLPYAGSGNATLNLTLSDGTTKTGAKYCYYGGTTRLTTHYPAGSVIHLTYRENVSIAGSSTTYTGWWADANYYNDTYDRTRYSKAIKAGSTAIVAKNIIVAKDGAYTHLNLGNAFDVNYPILYAGSAISAGSTGTNNFLAMPFTVTTTQSITLTAYKPVYIKGTLSGSLFTPVSTTPLTQDVPTAEDGYQYILLGTSSSTTEMYLLNEHPIFQYSNGAFKTVNELATDAAKTATNYLKFNNGLIVAKDAENWSSGRNVFIDDEAVNIRKGSLIYAKYGENIELYADQYAGNTASPSFILGKDTLIDDLENSETNYVYRESAVDYPIEPGSNITIDTTAPSSITVSAGLFLYEIHFSVSLKTIYLLAYIPAQINNVRKVYWNSDNKTKIFIGTSTNGTTFNYTEYPITYLDNDCKQVLNGNLWIENTGDANGIGYPSPPLGIGTKGGEHLEIDANEIMAKSDEYTPSHLYLNQEGGNVSVNNNCRRSIMFQNGAMFARNYDAYENDEDAKWLSIVDGINESGNTTFAYGNWLNSIGLTNIYGAGINLVTQNLPIGVDTGTPDGTKDTTKKIMLSKLLNGYYGLVNPDGGDESYVRSPKQGIIPYASGGNATHGLTTKIGTEAWPFYSGYFEYLYVTNWIKVGGTKVSLEGHGHAWSEITGKPSSYTPASHTHAWSTITDKPSSYTPESHHHTAVYSSDDSAHILMGKDTNYYFRPSTNTASPYTYLGSSSHKWKQLYATTTTINTSDLKEKRDVEKLDDKYIQMFDLIEPYSYKTINGDRVHTGFIAQYVEDAMEQVGLTIEELGFLCKDARNIEEEDEHGNILSKTPVLDEDGNQIYDYGLRYSEYIAICVAKIKQQEKRIDELEAKVNALLEKE